MSEWTRKLDFPAPKLSIRCGKVYDNLDTVPGFVIVDRFGTLIWGGLTIAGCMAVLEGLAREMPDRFAWYVGRRV